MRGHLVSFIGIDCCGKGTQIRLLENYLSEKKIKYKTFKDPGSSSLGNILRGILLNPERVYNALEVPFETRHPFSEVMLYMTARSELVQKCIKPARDNGFFVILDRYHDCTRAYQGGGRFNHDEVYISRINLINDIILDGEVPEKTFFLDINYNTMIDRIKKMGKNKDYLESQPRDFFERVIKEYEKIAEENKERVVIVQGVFPEIEIFNFFIKPEIDYLLARKIKGENDES